MVAFAGVELSGRLKDAGVSPRYLPFGGLITGVFGGLSGHQGAFRSAFLIRVGLPKESFIATGVAISAAIDVSRVSAYSARIAPAQIAQNRFVLVAAAGAAFLGTLFGNRLLRKKTLRTIERTVAIMLVMVALGLGSGAI